MFVVASASSLSASDVRKKHHEGPFWRFELANDIVFSSDNQFTNGFSIQRQSALSTRRDELRGLFLGRAIARLLPDRDDLLYRSALTIGQNMQTPDDILDENLILDDVPYIGMLAMSSTAVAFDDRRFTGIELLVGVVGHASQADHVQKLVHDVVGSEDPAGWANQLDNEPLVNLYIMRKRKLWRSSGHDGAFSLDAAAGNLATSASAALELRFGSRPGGFLYTATPHGVAVRHSAVLPDERRTLVFGSVALRATAYAFFQAREGNAVRIDNGWTDRNVLDPERLVAQAVIGFHLQRPKWSLHFNWWLTTDTVDTGMLAAGEDPANNFGMFSFERRF